MVTPADSALNPVRRRLGEGSTANSRSRRPGLLRETTREFLSTECRIVKVWELRSSIRGIRARLLAPGAEFGFRTSLVVPEGHAATASVVAASPISRLVADAPSGTRRGPSRTHPPGHGDSQTLEPTQFLVPDRRARSRRDPLAQRPHGRRVRAASSSMMSCSLPVRRRRGRRRGSRHRTALRLAGVVRAAEMGGARRGRCSRCTLDWVFSRYSFGRPPASDIR